MAFLRGVPGWRAGTAFRNVKPIGVMRGVPAGGVPLWRCVAFQVGVLARRSGMPRGNASWRSCVTFWRSDVLAMVWNIMTHLYTFVNISTY